MNLGQLAKAQVDSTVLKAEKLFNLVITGEPESYGYFSKDFQEHLSRAQVAGLEKQFLGMFGKFINVDKAEKFTKNGTDYVLINTSFENANPLFSLTFDKQGKVIGFLVPKLNLKSSYKDPAYADRTKYEEKQINVEVGKFKLPGILTTPKNASNFPIMILVQGSGPGDKDESVYSLKPFRDLALGLAAKGIATIRYDKRTSIYKEPVEAGQDFTVRQETEDDALAAIQIAKMTVGVDKKQIYCLGLSLGGMLMPRIASRTADLAGIVIAAGPARSLQNISIEQNKLASAQMHGTQSGLDSAIAIVNETRFKTLGNRQPNSPTIYGPASYILDLNNYNQTEVVKKFKGKILILQGEKDFQVSMIDFNLWKSALKSNKKATAISFPTLGHPFVLAGKTNTIADYQTLQNVAPEVIETISNWVLNK